MAAFSFLIFLVLLIVCLAVSMGDLVPAQFDSEVIANERVWAVEFYSGMCGSCQEFSPIWDSAVSTLKTKIAFGKVNIDQPEGLQLAKRLGVLEEGIPNVRVFSKFAERGYSIVTGKIYAYLIFYR
jgi:thioredoxin-like negative regulator of GroEL